MITPDALIVAAQKRLAHRSYRDSDGRTRMLRDDDRAVWLTPSQYRDLVVEYAEAMQPINRRLKRGFALAIPVTLLTLVITFNFGIGRAIDALPIPGVSALAGLIVLTWWPFLILFYHWRSVRAVNAALNELLCELPLAPAPPARPVALQTLEIIGIFLVGPWIFIDVVGTLFPRAFDGTPLMGRSVGPETLVGIAIFALITVRRFVNLRHFVNHWTARDRAAPAEAVSAPDPSDRLRSVIARARPSDDNAPPPP